ncbi:hypothetical protein P8452_52438 [Trifolium repens]|nr:hypothetical protein P8452_52438 [Trifolium repens]
MFNEPDATSSSIPPPYRPTPPTHTTILPAYRPTTPAHTTIVPEYRPTPPGYQPTPPTYNTIVPEYRPTPPAYTMPGVLISNNLFGLDGTPFLEMMKTFERPQHQQQQQQPQQQQQESPQQQQEPLEQEREHVRVDRRRRKITGEVEVVGERAIIEPFGDSLRPTKEVAKGIRIAIQRVYLKPYPTYKAMMKDGNLKEKLFEEFLRVCAWEPHHDE